MCLVNEEQLEIKCSSFLDIYVSKVSYGRTFAAAKQLCDGDKPDDTTAPDKDCLDEAVQTNVMTHAKSVCHGKATCEMKVPSLPLDPVCDGLKRELRIEHICGEFTQIEVFYHPDFNQFSIAK